MGVCSLSPTRRRLRSRSRTRRSYRNTRRNPRGGRGLPQVRADGVVQLSQLILRIWEPDAPPREVTVREGMTLGRDPKSDCVIHDETVSDQHARVERAGDDWTLHDLDSLNGIRVRERGEVKKHRTLVLTPGLEFRIGKTRLEVGEKGQFDATLQAPATEPAMAPATVPTGGPTLPSAPVREESAAGDTTPASPGPEPVAPEEPALVEATQPAGVPGSASVPSSDEVPAAEVELGLPTLQTVKGVEAMDEVAKVAGAPDASATAGAGCARSTGHCVHREGLLPRWARQIERARPRAGPPAPLGRPRANSLRWAPLLARGLGKCQSHALG